MEGLIIISKVETPEEKARKEKEKEREPMKREIIALAKELVESHKVFPFPGIGSKTYEYIKADDAEGYSRATPIDELLEKFKNEGMKVVFGSDPESGNVFILPSKSDDIESDNIFPKFLLVNETMDERVKKLILVSAEYAREAAK